MIADLLRAQPTYRRGLNFLSPPFAVLPDHLDGERALVAFVTASGEVSFGLPALIIIASKE